MKVLLVCSGNTCRSPMAAAILRKLAQEKAIELEVDSCGLDATVDAPATNQAMQVMAERGFDLSNHRAKAFDESLAEQADIILTMTSSHREQIIQRWPTLASKTYTLSEYAQGTYEEVKDPYMGTVEEYRATADQLQRLLELALENIAGARFKS